MRHLFIRGSYKPFGVSGEALVQNLLILAPEIYGSMGDSEKVEIDGLLYVLERLPTGIEECRQIRMVSREGLEKSHFKPIVPEKRRRNCYRVDSEQMYIELTRGRSDIYDILTHLTFLYIEAGKIKSNSLTGSGKKKKDWLRLEEIVEMERLGEIFPLPNACAYLSTIIGATFAETEAAAKQFAEKKNLNSLFHTVYWLGRLAIEETESPEKEREITFSSTLRERIGLHVYGSEWAHNIKHFLREKDLLRRPLHLISANLHSVMNTLYAFGALQKESPVSLEQLARELSMEQNASLRDKVKQFALHNGLYEIPNTAGTNITVQIIDLRRLPMKKIAPEIAAITQIPTERLPVLLVMDYAFGEQAFETMDELLKPWENGEERIPLPIESISIMGKAGILEGEKGDIMIPTAHLFEGTTDNYPLDNEFTQDDFAEAKLRVFTGPLITVLGTSLQNRDILDYFRRSSWKAIGLEMEGAHYQKAIQAAARIRKNIKENVRIRYAYYASDNPLLTGKTLASGSLGVEGVKPTYLITVKILEKILGFSSITVS